jgi:hypothetical protein
LPEVPRGKIEVPTKQERQFSPAALLFVSISYFFPIKLIKDFLCIDLTLRPAGWISTGHNALGKDVLSICQVLFAAGDTIWLNERLVYLAKAIFFASLKPVALPLA